MKTRETKKNLFAVIAAAIGAIALAIGAPLAANAASIITSPSSAADSSTIQVDLSNLDPSGVYFVGICADITAAKPSCNTAPAYYETVMNVSGSTTVYLDLQSSFPVTHGSLSYVDCASGAGSDDCYVTVRDHTGNDTVWDYKLIDIY